MVLALNQANVVTVKLYSSKFLYNNNNPLCLVELSHTESESSIMLLFCDSQYAHIELLKFSTSSAVDMHFPRRVCEVSVEYL